LIAVHLTKLEEFSYQRFAGVPARLWKGR